MSILTEPQMSATVSLQPQPLQRDPDSMTRLGGWLFKHRTLIPIPLALPLLFLRAGEAPASRLQIIAGIALVACGELVRLRAVRNIGAISRTRRDRLGPLVATGPFARVRNPLYLGNIALWTGFALVARLPWMVPVVVVLLGFEYHAIVRWEEHLLESRLGDDYRAYAARVPRWIPSLKATTERGDGPYSWRETIFSERGTLIAIAVGGLWLWTKARF